jgi:hypothetical protein
MAAFRLWEWMVIPPTIAALLTSALLRKRR